MLCEKSDAVILTPPIRVCTETRARVSMVSRKSVVWGAHDVMLVKDIGEVIARLCPKDPGVVKLLTTIVDNAGVLDELHRMCETATTAPMVYVHFVVVTHDIMLGDGPELATAKTFSVRVGDAGVIIVPFSVVKIGATVYPFSLMRKDRVMQLASVVHMMYEPTTAYPHTLTLAFGGGTGKKRIYMQLPDGSGAFSLHDYDAANAYIQELVQLVFPSSDPYLVRLSNAPDSDFLQYRVTVDFMWDAMHTIFAQRIADMALAEGAHHTLEGVRFEDNVPQGKTDITPTIPPWMLAYPRQPHEADDVLGDLQMMFNKDKFTIFVNTTSNEGARVITTTYAFVVHTMAVEYPEKSTTKHILVMNPHADVTTVTEIKGTVQTASEEDMYMLSSDLRKAIFMRALYGAARVEYQHSAYPRYRHVWMQYMRNVDAMDAMRIQLKQPGDGFYAPNYGGHSLLTQLLGHTAVMEGGASITSALDSEAMKTREMTIAEDGGKGKTHMVVANHFAV